MSEAMGFVLAAGGIEIANEVIFAPLAGAGGKPWDNLNWRLIPATAILALTIGGIEKLNPEFGKILGMLIVGSVLVIPYGKAPTPLQNIAKVIGA